MHLMQGKFSPLERALCVFSSNQGCQNRDPDRKIARFYDPTSPKRLKL